MVLLEMSCLPILYTMQQNNCVYNSLTNDELTFNTNSTYNPNKYCANLRCHGPGQSRVTPMLYINKNQCPSGTSIDPNITTSLCRIQIRVNSLSLYALPSYSINCLDFSGLLQFLRIGVWLTKRMRKRKH